MTITGNPEDSTGIAKITDYAGFSFQLCQPRIEAGKLWHLEPRALSTILQIALPKPWRISSIKS